MDFEWVNKYDNKGEVDKDVIKNKNNKELNKNSVNYDYDYDYDSKSLLNNVENYKLRNQELKKIKGGLDVNINKDINFHNKDVIIREEIGNKSFVLDVNFEFDSLPKISEWIINKDVIKNVPENLKSLVPMSFNLNELDQKFSDFIKFLFISKKHLSNKNFKFLVHGFFNILTDLGVDMEIKNIYIKFLSSDVEIIKEFDTDKYKNVSLELIKYCERRQCTLNIDS